VARNRQRAKERQAKRKANRPDGADGGAGTRRSEQSRAEPAVPSPAPTAPEAATPEPALPPETATPDPALPPDAPAPRPERGERDNGREELRERVELEVGAPPEELGRSDEVLDEEPVLEDDEHFDPAEDVPEEDLEESPGPRGRRDSSEAAEHKERSRLVQFLFAVRAELARVQWPDRQTLTTLTGVVLGFVLIAGGYLGLLDAIFSRVVQAIL